MNLMRKSVQEALRGQPRSPHAGLWLARGWKELAASTGDEQDAGKGKHLELLWAQQPSDLYKLAHARWQQVTGDAGRFRSLYAELPQRLFIGLAGGASALETGVSTSHSYGMPMIPGSSVKGAVRAHAKAIGVTADYLAVLFGEDETGATGSQRLPGAGCLVWHDAWWVPDNNGPFVGEVVTVHHPGYYAGKEEATDFDSPVPNAQVAVRGSFHFVVEGDPAWAEMAVALLRGALEQSGIGAKRAAGYGGMVEDEKATSKARREQEERLRSGLGPEDAIRLDLKNLEGMDEGRLVKRLLTMSKECPPENQPLLRAIGVELFGDVLRSWARETNSSHKEKARTYKFFMGEKT